MEHTTQQEPFKVSMMHSYHDGDYSFDARNKAAAMLSKKTNNVESAKFYYGFTELFNFFKENYCHLIRASDLLIIALIEGNSHGLRALFMSGLFGEMLEDGRAEEVNKSTGNVKTEFENYRKWEKSLTNMDRMLRLGRRQEVLDLITKEYHPITRQFYIWAIAGGLPEFLLHYTAQVSKEMVNTAIECSRIDILPNLLNDFLAMEDFLLPAIGTRNPNLVSTILAYNPNVHSIHIFEAIKSGNFEVFQMLVFDKLVNKREDSRGETPFLTACRYGRVAMAVTLINFGVELTAVDFRRQNAVHLSVMSGEVEMLHFILTEFEKRGILEEMLRGRNIRNDSECLVLKFIPPGNFIYFQAERGEYDRIVCTPHYVPKSFILAGAGHPTERDTSALKARYSYKKCQYGLSKDMTPLHYAIWTRQRQMVVMLIEKNADVTIRDSFFMTASHYIAMKDMRGLLVPNNFETDYMGRTPMCLLSNVRMETEIAQETTTSSVDLPSIGKLYSISYFIDILKDMDRKQIAALEVKALKARDFNFFLAAHFLGVFDVFKLTLYRRIVNIGDPDLTEFFSKIKDDEDKMCASDRSICQGHWSETESKNILFLTIRSRRLDFFLRAEKYQPYNSYTRMNGHTLISQAIVVKAYDILNYIVKKVNPNVKNNGVSPLEFSLGLNDLVSFGILLNNGAELDQSLETIPSLLNFPEMFSLFRNLEVRGLHDGMTPLLRASFSGKWRAMDWLIQHGADVEAKDSHFRNALHHMINTGDYDAFVEHFWNFAAVKNAKDRWLPMDFFMRVDGKYKGKEVFHYIIVNKDVLPLLLSRRGISTNISSYGRCLLSGSFKPTARDKEYIKSLDFLKQCIGEDMSPLNLAIWQGQDQIAIFLIEQGVDLSSRDSFGRTAMHFAAIKGSLEVMKKLIEKGADIFSVSDNGHTPLSLSTLNQRKDCREFLEAEIKKNTIGDLEFNV